jgi:uncharacterized membrane protein
MKRGWHIALGALILVLVVSGFAMAETDEGTKRLEDGEALTIAIDNTEGDDLWIELEVQVLDGPDVNVWFTDEEGYTDFFDREAPVFSYYHEHSQEETSYAEDSFYWDHEGIFYVIIDNIQNDATGQSAVVQYNVTWEVNEFGELLLVGVLVIIVVIVVVVVLVLLMVVLKRAQTLAEEAKQAERAKSYYEPVSSEGEGRPQPPEPYPEWVVRASTDAGMDEDDASGWDPGHDEPVD